MTPARHVRVENDVNTGLIGLPDVV